jgi:hypothetical protein
MDSLAPIHMGFLAREGCKRTQSLGHRLDDANVLPRKHLTAYGQLPPFILLFPEIFSQIFSRRIGDWHTDQTSRR